MSLLTVTPLRRGMKSLMCGMRLQVDEMLKAVDL